MLSDDTYSWDKSYGTTAEEAFRQIRGLLVEVIEAAQQGDLERIEGTDVCWPTVKWKVAFLYQNREKPRIFPVFREETLFDHYRLAAPGTKRKEVSRAVMYPTLLDRYSERGDVFEIAKYVWGDGKKPSAVRYWALPLLLAMSVEEAEALSALLEVNPEDLPPLVHEMLADAELRVGDEVALLCGDTVRAVGKIESAEPEAYAWSQQPVKIVPELGVLPSKVIELDESERGSIWDELELNGASGEIQYWKISPGENAHLWEEWRDGNYIAIGSPLLGDVSKLTREEFDELLEELQRKHNYRPNGPKQVWHFFQMPVGSKVIANQGTTKILGVGTVTGSYEYHSEAGEFCHRRSVRWEDLTERKIERRGWVRTLVNLKEADFLQLTDPKFEYEAKAKNQEQVEISPGPCPEPQSLILFGPPGTGKTWTTMTRALQLLFPAEEVASWSADTRARQFREHQRLGRIEFVTFHQAYGYEEFVEGIRPVMSADATEQVRYELHPGVFKRIALRAAGEGLRSNDLLSDEEAHFEQLWNELLRRIQDGELEEATSQRGLKYSLAVSSGRSVVIQRIQQGQEDMDATGKQTAARELVWMLWMSRSELGPTEEWSYQATGDVFRRERGTDGGHHYTAVWIATAKLEELSEQLPRAKRENARERSAKVQQALDRPLGSTVDFRFTDQTKPYVLIIDEINRGNISKILGELITLLEPDKRLGAVNELKLPLAYSPQHRFAVPPNLHIIGTMNTADRSIALMDVALRRRFRFEEMLPQSDVIRKVLSEHVSNVALVDLVCEVFDTLNARIRQLLDRDHQIGHAYFLKVRSLQDLREVFAERVIPLLQEYFYGAWERVCVVLGCPYDEDGMPLRSGPCVDSLTREYRAPMIHAVLSDSQKVLGFVNDEHHAAIDFQVSPTFRPVLATRARPDDRLLEHFLGLLNLDTALLQDRISAFAMGEQE